MIQHHWAATTMACMTALERCCDPCWPRRNHFSVESGCFLMIKVCFTVGCRIGTWKPWTALRLLFRNGCELVQVVTHTVKQFSPEMHLTSARGRPCKVSRWPRQLTDLEPEHSSDVMAEHLLLYLSGVWRQGFSNQADVCLCACVAGGCYQHQ